MPDRSVDPMRLVPLLQERVGSLTNELIMRDALIEQLEAEIEKLKSA